MKTNKFKVKDNGKTYICILSNNKVWLVREKGNKNGWVSTYPNNKDPKNWINTVERIYCKKQLKLLFPIYGYSILDKNTKYLLEKTKNTKFLLATCIKDNSKYNLFTKDIKKEISKGLFIVTSSGDYKNEN